MRVSKIELNVLGYEVNEDPDQPGKFYWRNDQEGSEISFDSEDEAIAAATRDAKETYGLHRCDNCGKLHSDETLVLPIKDIFQRVEAGGVMPSGECSDCGSLCYKLTDEAISSDGFLISQINDLLDHLQRVVDSDNQKQCVWTNGKLHPSIAMKGCEHLYGVFRANPETPNVKETIAENMEQAHSALIATSRNILPEMLATAKLLAKMVAEIEKGEGPDLEPLVKESKELFASLIGKSLKI